MSTTDYLRVGIVFTVTGILAIVHSALADSGRLPQGVAIGLGVVLVVVGVSFLGAAVRRRRSAV